MLGMENSRINPYVSVHVVVQFYPWFKYYIPLFWSMVMYDNEFNTKEKKNKPGKKLNHNIHISV